MREKRIGPFRRVSLFALSSIGLLGLFTSPTYAQKKVPTLLLEIEKKYQKAGSLEAEFSQVQENTHLSQKKKTSSGKLFIRFPAQLRWETQKPDPNLLVSDGQTFWYYTPPFDSEESGQLIQKKASEVRSELASDLLSGSFSSLRKATITQETKTRYLITPQAGSAGTVQEAILEIHPQERTIQKVILIHTGGNQSQITLSHIELGKTLPVSLFTFQAPPKTEIIRE